MDSLVRSVRSVISLSSVSSQTHGEPRGSDANNYSEIEGTRLKAPGAAAHLQGFGEDRTFVRGVKAYALHQRTEPWIDTESGVIHVENTVSQKADDIV